MKHVYKILLSTIFILSATTTSAQSDGVLGTWKTESSDKGYLHVLIEECGEALCGKIENAYDLENEVGKKAKSGIRVKIKRINRKCRSVAMYSVFQVAYWLFVEVKTGLG